MNRIKELRIENKMTQSELGKKLGVQDAAISKYESERVPLVADTIEKLCIIFNVSADYLLGKSNIKKTKDTSNKEIGDHDIKFALFGTTDIDDETYESVKNFAKFAAEQKRKKREGR